MSMELLLAALGLVLTTFVAYHIAYRQGTFRPARLKIRFGDQLKTKRVLSKKAPWAIVLGIPKKPADLYLVELPVILECGPQALKNIQIQASYPRGRHASEHLDLKPSSGFADNLQSRIIGTATHSLVEFAFDLQHPETTSVVVDLVAYKATDFTVASYDREAEDLPELSYVAEKVQVFASAENHGQVEVSCWLAAVRADNLEELGRLSSWLFDILFQLDKIYVEVGKPGQLVPMPWYERQLVSLVSLAFRTRTGKILRDCLSDGPRHIGEAFVAPVVNSESPRVIVET